MNTAMQVRQMVEDDTETKAWYGCNNTTTHVQAMGYIGQTYYYPTYPIYPAASSHHVTVIEDKTKTAFALAKKLIKSKYMTAEKVEDFISLVEMIEKEL